MISSDARNRIGGDSRSAMDADSIPLLTNPEWHSGFVRNVRRGPDERMANQAPTPNQGNAA